MMGDVIKISELVAIGKTHQKSAVQVTLRWLIQRGLAVIPKSVNPKRIGTNFDDFELNDEEMAIIERLNQNRTLGEGLSHIE